MEQENIREKIDITLHNPGEEGELIKLVVGDAQNAIFCLSLQQARTLATALIQQVHHAEVRNSVKNARQKSTQSAKERTGTNLIPVPNSQQA